ncbi:MAG: hypothetical protein AAF205_04090, partial [Pseudomonadota bacterium]
SGRDAMTEMLIRTPAARAEPIDILLSGWAATGRAPASAADASRRAADAALAEIARADAATPASGWRRGAVMFGGAAAAAVAGVLIYTGIGPAGPASDVGQPQMAEMDAPAAGSPVSTPSMDAEDPFGAPQMLPDDMQMASAAGVAGDVPVLSGADFDQPNDDLLMVGYVFTPRPEEEFILP